MSYKGNYSVVVDEQEFNKFLQWLPPLEKEECHYVALLERDKYIRGLGIGTFNSDKHQCARFTTTSSSLVKKLNFNKELKWSTQLNKTLIGYRMVAHVASLKNISTSRFARKMEAT